MKDYSSSISAERARKSLSSSSIESTLHDVSTTDTTVMKEQQQRLPRRSNSVTFAPLPEVAQRKRRSRVPLGVSGRAELMRRRRTSGYEYGEDEEDGGRPHRSSGGMGRPPDSTDDLEVVFVAMGKFIKDTGRHLWKRMAKDTRRKGEGEGGEKEGEDEGSPEEVLDLKDTKEEGETEVREVVFIEGEEGVEVQFPQDLSQTETVGRGYTWRTVSIVAKRESCTPT